jgi:hypothetical protein
MNQPPTTQLHITVITCCATRYGWTDKPPIFKFKYCSKTLGKPKDNLEDLKGYQIVIIKCLMQRFQ